MIAPPLTAAARRRAVLLIVLLFLGTRLVVWTAAYTGAVLNVRIAHQVQAPLSWHAAARRAELQDPQSPLRRALAAACTDFAPLLRWDAGHYRSIITDGYRYAPPRPATPPHENQWNIAFFPLYPLICIALAPLLGIPAAMIFVANASALLAGFAAWAWARRRTDDHTAICFVALLYAWPTACYYSFGYAESLALLMLCTCLWLADSARPWLAALAAALAGATRPTTVLIAPLLAGHVWLTGRASPPARRGARALACGVLSLAGAAAYALFLRLRFGSLGVYGANLRQGWIPLDSFRWDEFLTLEHVWEQFAYIPQALLGFPAGLVHLANPLAWNLPLSAVLIAASLAFWRHAPVQLRPWLLLAPLIFLQRYLVSGWSVFGLESLARYLGLAAPAFLVLAIALAPRRSAAVVSFTLLTLLQAVWALNFGLSEWTG